MHTDDTPGPKAMDPPAEGALDPADERLGHSLFPIVGIGASAGGLEAFSQLLAHVPEQTGMAFLLVQHLDPKHESRLTDLLAKGTRMPVLEATHGLAVVPDHVYIIPPNTNMAIAQGVLQVTPRGEGPGPHLPVDYLFRSLAADQQTRAIGVVLSGTGSDGTLGLCEIKAVGGITFAEDEKSARHSGMPRSAMDSGSVDFVLPPAEIARRLAEIGVHPYLAPAPPPTEEPAEAEDQFKKILAAVRAVTGVDFSEYRDTTIRRRIMRRMALHGQQSLADYAQLLQTERAEVEALYRDLLINVTSFFRDAAMFETLQSSVFPEIVKGKGPTTPIRVWVPGCSTGQEAYSLAMALVEFFDDKPVRPPIQIFATDLSDPTALERARAGIYPESIEAEVTPARLRRFFHKEDHLYRIDKSIRDACVFARQNVTADPPFSHVDLISCRNVLIYMAPLLQKRVVPTFHYALNVPGFLVLGPSETVGEFTDLFDMVDRGHKIYGKKETVGRPAFHFMVEKHKALTARTGGRTGPPSFTLADFQKEADRLVLGRYAPPGVLVNESFDILQFRGRTSPYLEPPVGEPTTNLLKMAREGLFLELRSALNEARSRNEPIRREGVRVRDEHGAREVNLHVLPVKPTGDGENLLLVLFEDAGVSAREPAPGQTARGGKAPPSSWLARWFGSLSGERQPPEPAGQEGPNSPRAPTAPAADREVVQLRHELAATKEYLQSLVEQQDSANEELRSANEEILSSNEELQSTNEELETAKEELQSTNEELNTVNEQLNHRNVELNQLTNDLTNVLASTAIPVVMVGSDLRIRRLTAAAKKVMNLLATDVGRPIGDIKANVDVPDLEKLIADVIEHVHVQEREVRDRDGRWYALRVHPYRTADNKVDGAVVVLLDIDQVKTIQEEAREARDYAQSIVETVREPLVILDGRLRVQTANKAFYRMFTVTPEETQNQLLYELGNEQWDIPALRHLLEEVLPKHKAFEDYEVEHAFPQIGRKIMILNARCLYRADSPALILLAIEDITERKLAEERKRVEERLQASLREKEVLLQEVHHRVKNNLQVISGLLHLQARSLPDAQVAALFRESESRVKAIALIHEKLYQSADFSAIDFASYVSILATDLFRTYQIQADVIGLQISAADVFLDMDRAVPCALILNELISNCLKHAFPAGRQGEIRVECRREANGDCRLTVADNGIGWPKEVDVQTAPSLGLRLVRILANQLGGTLHVDSDGGAKAELQFPTTAPRAPGEQGIPEPESAAQSRKNAP